MSTQMPCGNTQAEIDRDHNQYARDRSIEHIEATNALRERKREMVEALLKNNYYTVGKNTYTLRDAIECIQSDEFWNTVVADGSLTIGEKEVPWTCLNAFEQEPELQLIETAYVEGRLSKWHPDIHSHVVSLVDIVLGDL